MSDQSIPNSPLSIHNHEIHEIENIKDLNPRLSQYLSFRQTLSNLKEPSIIAKKSMYSGNSKDSTYRKLKQYSENLVNFQNNNKPGSHYQEDLLLQSDEDEEQLTG